MKLPRALLLQRVYLNPAVFFGISVEAESYRNDLLALLEEFK